MFFLLLLLLPLCALSNHYQVPESHVKVSDELGNVRLFHSHEGFHVRHLGELVVVEKKNMDTQLRKMTTKQLKQFLSCGYIVIKKNHSKFYLTSKLFEQTHS